MLNSSQLREMKILVIDDVEANATFVERMLEWAGYENVKSVLDPQQAVAFFQAFQPDLVLLDLHMPHIDGYELLKAFQEVSPAGSYVPILVFTADVTPEARRRALSLGASDFLTKPGNATEIVLRVKNFLHTRYLHRCTLEENLALELKVQERTKLLEEAQLEMLERLALAAEFRDDETGEHTRRVGDMSARIASEMGWTQPQIEMIRRAAPLHDIGKIGVPDAILLKPARLTFDEMELMKLHTDIGARILRGSKSPLLQMATTIAHTHHEHWDGTGYGEGLRGEDIPVAGRIVAVADVYDALTHERPYKDSWNIAEAVEEIHQQSGRHFDPMVVEAFLLVISAELEDARRRDEAETRKAA